MSLGLIALLDDVAAIAKVAAASLDDVAAQAGRAGLKAAGVVIDDAAVTPRYVVGFAAARELPIVGKIAIGSLRNKLLFLLPVALLLGAFAPWAVTPLLMLGGVYLCYEGAEKIFEVATSPHGAPEPETPGQGSDPETVEDEKVGRAIKTDFILSAEIMAITLAAVPEGSFWSQAFVLAVVGTAITFLVYGGVALIVKADDLGVALARTTSRSWWGAVVRGIGRALVRGMPILLRVLSIVGTAAMIWVGGGILLHGAEVFGWAWPAHAVEAVADGAASWAVALGVVPGVANASHWVVGAAGSGLAGLLVGGLAVLVMARVIKPFIPASKGARDRSPAGERR